jgi:signal transduction histidine kinase
MAGRAEKEKTAEYVQRISATTHQVIRSLDEVVWAINPRNDNLCDMIQYTGQFAIEFLTAAGVRCVLDLPDKIPDSPVSAEVRHNFFLVVKETLNNITRHARAGEVKLSASISGNEFCMSIADDGQGFKKENADAFANGVRNMQQRMEEIHGRCNIESVSGKGTRVTLSFPVGK